MSTEVSTTMVTDALAVPNATAHAVDVFCAVEVAVAPDSKALFERLFQVAAGGFPVASVNGAANEFSEAEAGPPRLVAQASVLLIGKGDLGPVAHAVSLQRLADAGTSSAGRKPPGSG